MENYDYYTYLSEEEIENFKKHKYIISGMKGLLFFIILDKLDSSGKFQFEISKKFNLDVFLLANKPKLQFDCAKKLISSFSEEQLINEMIFYSIFAYSEDNSCYFPDFSSFKRKGRDYYIKVEKEFNL